MKIKLYHVAALFVIIIILQVSGEYAGLLDPSRNIIWYDNVMHALAGVLSGIFVMWAVEKESIKISKKRLGIYIVIVAFLMAVFWELFELAIFKMLKDYAISYNYSTTLAEAILDSLSNTIGASILAIINYYIFKKN
ncbi:MAG: hypothetical protein AABW73_03150 [Nanoarchaeota archaeon]